MPSSTELPHINDAVLASRDPIIGTLVVESYVRAFQLGFRILAGIAVFKFVLCLGLKRVVLDDGKVKLETTEKIQEKEKKTNVEVVQPPTV